MFWKKNGGSNNGSQPAREIGLLGIDTRFKGTIRFGGTLRLDGVVDGNITSPEGSGSKLIINQDAVVTGNITSDSVLISGRVRGSIKAMERVEIFRAGSLKGDVFTGGIMIEGGAEFEGNCCMLNNLSPDQRQKVLDAAFSRSSRSAL